MADNLVTTPGVGGSTVATDDIGGVHYPRSKVVFGADGIATDVADSSGARLPVKVAEALPAGAAKIGAVDLDSDATLGSAIPATGQLVAGSDGVNSRAIKTDASGELQIDVLTLPNVTVGAALPAGDNNIGNVDIVSSALPTGAATLAEQQSQTTALQLIDNIVGTDGSAAPTTGAMMLGTDGTNAQTIKTDASGELQVDVLTLPNVTLAGSSNNIGDVDVLSLPAGTVAAAATAADNSTNSTTKAPTLPARANASSPTFTEGNQVPLSVTTSGNLRTIINNASPIDVAVTSQVPGVGPTNLGKAVDSIAGATDTGVAVLAIRDDALTTLTPVDGDYVPLRVSSTGALHVTGGGGGVQFAEDAAHVSGDSGTMALAVRRDANTSLVGTDGDYAPLQVDANGALKVNITAGAGSGGTASTDDAAFTVGAGSGTPMMGLADETTPDSVDEGDVGVVRMTLARALHVNIRDEAGDSCMDGANNALRVNIVAGAGSGGTAMTDDAAFTPATTSVTPMGAMADETTPDSVDEGDCGVVRMSLNRNLYTQIRDVSAERSCTVTAANALKVDGSAVTQPVSDAGGSLTVDGSVSLAAAIPAGSNKIGAVDLDSDATIAAAVPSVAQYVAGTDGTNARGLKTDASGELQVDVLTLPNVTVGAALPAGDNNIGNVDVVSSALPTGAATLAEQQTQTTALQLIDNIVGTDGSAAPTTGAMMLGTDGTNAQTIKTDTAGELQVDVLTLPNVTVGAALPAGDNNIGNVDVVTLPGVTGAAAHDAAVSGNPVLVGYEARTSDGTAVASGDAVRAIADTLGKQIVLPYSLPENLISGVTAAITGTGDTAVIAAQGAGVRIYVTSLLVTNSHATVGTVVEIKDGTTVIGRGYAAPAGGGFQMPLPSPLRLTANTALNAANVTTGSSTYITAVGYKAP